MKVPEKNSWPSLLKLVLLLIVKFLVIFAVTFTIWHFTAPVGTKVFASIAGGIVKIFDRAGFTKSISSYDEYIVVNHKYDKDEKPLFLEYKGFSFNAVFLITLIMIVPNVNYKLRLKILVLGLLIIFPEQIFRLVIYIFNYYCLNISRKGGATIYPAYIHNTIGYIDKVMIRIDGQIVPVVIWAALFYYYKWHNIYSKLKRSRFAEKESRPK